MLTPSEKEFQAQVLELAAWTGWLVYHTFDSRRSHAGFPDLVLVRGTRIIFAELKSERGRVSSEQQTWLDALGTVAADLVGPALPPTAPVLVRVWRPTDWPEIEAVLTARRS